MGLHGRCRPHRHSPGLVDHGVSRHRHPDLGAGAEPDRRRPQRRAQPAPQQGWALSMSQETSKHTAVTIRNLKLALPKGGDRAYAVDGVSFDLTAGKILCVVGESGSGKSMCAHALMGLLPDTVTSEAGEITFDGQNLLKLDEEGWLGLRGRRVAMVFQEPMTALNPLMRIGDQ